ncbi:hypothetical protein MPTK1_4g09550 [Marchantia polymorpha subsp. ruderalis]|uniref:Uncharacterized protein n=2 Tax=Marchantia polymorpha TaxID=3197 RepID=A0AAF6B852_MARPO|nr:hypothetical protein MARPO_0112s0060 [Marchantia polymorpha]BBN08186.1 hypothetical protein Mp_4g09550 [Marchantia polymorpha subsp. ruderalis]|eukprot:PTQ31420.1 hypothetical protein MARPO_0112s0060 [Marchantia polymorpha]
MNIDRIRTEVQPRKNWHCTFGCAGHKSTTSVAGKDSSLYFRKGAISEIVPNSIYCCMELSTIVAYF